MKKNILTLIILFLLLIPLDTVLAHQAQPHAELSCGAYIYMMPRSGSAGIPMNPKYDAAAKTGAYGPITKIKNSYYGTHSDSSMPYGKYSQDELIAFGGMMDIPGGSWENSQITVTADCANGFFFVSQSNPSYKRPFELYIIPKAKHSGWPTDEAYGKEALVLKNAGDKATFKYSEITSPLVGTDYQMWVDIVLVLPGTIVDDVLTDEQGHEFPLTEAYDYSAVVNISITGATKPNGSTGPLEESVKVQATVPFSGFYTRAKAEKMSSAISMHVQPSSQAGNLDLTNYATFKDPQSGIPQEVGTIRVQSVYEVRRENERTESFAIYLSSSSDTTTLPEDGFKLVKEGLSFGVPRTVYNSIGYKVVLVNEIYDSSRTQNSSQEFLGKDYHSNNTAPSTAVYPISTYFKKDRRGIISGLNTVTFDYVGTVYIEIEDPRGIVLEAGKYESDIYVHVVEL